MGSFQVLWVTVIPEFLSKFQTPDVSRMIYRKSPKFNTQNVCCNNPKFEQRGLSIDGMTISEDPDQTAPLGAVLSGDAMFA